jgi:hypothetical protein
MILVFICYQVTESMTSLAVAAGNALISRATMTSQAEEAGINAFSTVVKDETDKDKPEAPAPAPVAPTTSPNGVSSQPNAAALSDPAAPLVQVVLTLVNGIEMLLTGGENGKPDWDKIRGKDVRDFLSKSPFMLLIEDYRTQRTERSILRIV